MTITRPCPHCALHNDRICACGNLARYVNERDEVCCAICPIKEGIYSIKRTNAADLWMLSKEYIYGQAYGSLANPGVDTMYALLAIHNSGPYTRILERVKWWCTYLDNNPDITGDDFVDVKQVEFNFNIRTLIGRRPS